MSTRRILLLVLQLGILFSLIPACSKEADDGSFRVAVVTPGDISDRGWNAGAFQGLIRIRDELGARIAHEVATGSQAQKQSLLDFAEEGFDLVFGHGYEFQEHSLAICNRYPKTIFIATSGSETRPNFSPMRFQIEEAAYVLGFLAAKRSKSGKVAAVGGKKIPSIQSSLEAFGAGARAARSDVEFVTSYVGSFEDIATAKESTMALLESGCDMIFHNANLAGLGVFKAVQQYGRGTRAFGSNIDQSEVAPDVILASAALGVPDALVQVATEVRDSAFEPRIRQFDLRQGIVQVVFNPRLIDELPDQLRSEIDALEQRIVAGEVTVPSGF